MAAPPTHPAGTRRARDEEEQYRGFVSSLVRTIGEGQLNAGAQRPRLAADVHARLDDVERRVGQPDQHDGHAITM